MTDQLTHEQDVLADLCSQYIGAWTRGDDQEMALTTGMIMGEVARIYRLNPPGGLVDVEGLFTILGLQLLGIEPDTESIHKHLMQANDLLSLDVRTQILARISELPKAEADSRRPLRDDDPAE